MSTHFPFSIPLPPDIIQRYRAQILASLINQDPSFAATPIVSIRQQTLDDMLSLYDRIFLTGYLKTHFCPIRISLSSRLTSSAGKFVYSKDPVKQHSTAEIRLSNDIFPRLKNGPFHLNGLCVKTPQEALLIVFEHELCHALEAALYGSTGHSSRFLQLATGLFGHTTTRHALPTRRTAAAQSGFVVGQKVSFFYNKHTLVGVLTYVGKTGTVMVPDLQGAYRDRTGKRYQKYRVPLHLLERS